VSVTVLNLIQGPGTLYRGTRYSNTSAYTGTAEPADAAVNTTPQSSAWTDVGGTKDGVNLEFSQEFSELEVDQLIDIPDRRQTKREFNITTNLAEATLENLAVALNETAPTTGSGYKTFEPTDGVSATQPYYVPLIFDGYAPSGYRRRVIARRMLSVEAVGVPYKKDDQTVFPVKFGAHYVSSSLRPWKIIDQTS
jgi:hypothetical protein